jgi:phosphate transport system permease protein
VITSLQRRRIGNGVMTAFCAAAVLIALLPVVSVLWLVIKNGVAGLSWSFFTALPTPVGEPGGGVGNAVLGTLLILGLACLIGLPLGIGVGIFLAEKGQGPFGSVIRFLVETLSGVPSIVMGVAAYALVVMPMKRFSALAGAVALAILMLPTLARGTEEMVKLVPETLREGALALGVHAWKASLLIRVRSAVAGIATATLLAIARAMGETAPLLFTALNNQYWNTRPDQPTSSLTVQIFTYAISPYPDWHQKAWSAALVLLLLVGLLAGLARLITRNRHRSSQ